MADNDGKIYITISDRRFGRNKAEADEQNKTEKNKENENPLADFAKHKFRNLIESQAKQAVNYTIGNIGNFTGDYINQTHMSEALNFVNSVLDIGAAAYAGLKYTGHAAGAIIAAGVAVAGKAITTGEQYYAGYVANVRQNRAIAQLRDRAGLDGTNNGSRGTEY